MAEPTPAPVAVAAEIEGESDVVAADLIEDISIDGMCGVY